MADTKTDTKAYLRSARTTAITLHVLGAISFFGAFGLLFFTSPGAHAHHVQFPNTVTVMAFGFSVVFVASGSGLWACARAIEQHIRSTTP
jgi:predicted membrane channel-forming protein YqfA (hemolysin III family)